QKTWPLLRFDRSNRLGKGLKPAQTRPLAKTPFSLDSGSDFGEIRSCNTTIFPGGFHQIDRYAARPRGGFCYSGVLFSQKVAGYARRESARAFGQPAYFSDSCRESCGFPPDCGCPCVFFATGRGRKFKKENLHADRHAPS